MTPSDALLSVQSLSVEFRTRRGVARVLDEVSFDLGRGETLGVVGESGCGKSVTALAVMRLIAEPPGRIAGGRVMLDGRDLLRLPEEQMRQVRGNRILGSHSASSSTSVLAQLRFYICWRLEYRAVEDQKHERLAGPWRRP